jgi:site-specific recombinase XerD
MRLSKIRFHENPEEASVEVLGKGNKWRSIPLPQITQEAILDYLRVRPEGKRLPKGADNDRLFWVYHPFKKQYTPLSRYTLGDYMREIRKKFPASPLTPSGTSALPSGPRTRTSRWSLPSFGRVTAS